MEGESHPPQAERSSRTANVKLGPDFWVKALAILIPVLIGLGGWAHHTSADIGVIKVEVKSIKQELLEQLDTRLKRLEQVYFESPSPKSKP